LDLNERDQELLNAVENRCVCKEVEMLQVRFESGIHSTAPQAAKAFSSSDLLIHRTTPEDTQVLVDSGLYRGS
jgi:hypothetical protein